MNVLKRVHENIRNNVKFSDEFYTRKEDVEAFLDKFDFTGYDIICPADSENSEIFKYLKNKCYSVKNATKFEDTDFTDYHIVITNPPFSLQSEFYKKCFKESECVISVISELSYYLNIDKKYIRKNKKVNKNYKYRPFQAYMRALNFQKGNSIKSFINPEGQEVKNACTWIYSKDCERFLKK
jgi:hypothetical protein